MFDPLLFLIPDIIGLYLTTMHQSLQMYSINTCSEKGRKHPQTFRTQHTVFTLLLRNFESRENLSVVGYLTFIMVFDCVLPNIATISPIHPTYDNSFDVSPLIILMCSLVENLGKHEHVSYSSKILPITMIYSNLI